MKILLAVDNTPQAEEAAQSVRHCVPGVDVQILHVLNIEAIPHSHLSAAMIDRIHERIRLRLKAEANRFLPQLFTVLSRFLGRVRVAIREGHAAEVILQSAREFRADLIVMGCRGLTEVQARLLKGVSYRVAEEAWCPVLLIKHALPSAPRVLLIHEESKGVEQAVSFLIEHGLFMSGQVLMASSSPLEKEALGNVEERLGRHGFTVETRALRGKAAATILSCACDAEIDVIAMTKHDKRARWTRWLWRSYWRQVMLRADKSVLIIR